MSQSPPIIYTWTDEAPALATYAFLPIIRAFARPLAEAFQSDLDRTGANFDLIIEVAELALVPDLDRALVARAVLADADALGVVTIGAEG